MKIRPVEAQSQTCEPNSSFLQFCERA